MLREIRPAIVLLVALTLITGLAYPLAMTGSSRRDLPETGARQPDRARRQGGRLRPDRAGVQGATNISTAGCRRPPRPDPADATKTVSAPYNAANSGGSNLGPTSKALADRVKEDVDKLKAENPSSAGPDRPRHHLGQRPRSRYFA